jgi:hypothetical protein
MPLVGNGAGVAGADAPSPTIVLERLGHKPHLPHQVSAFLAQASQFPAVLCFCELVNQGAHPIDGGRACAHAVARARSAEVPIDRPQESMLAFVWVPAVVTGQAEGQGQRGWILVSQPGLCSAFAV